MSTPSRPPRPVPPTLTHRTGRRGVAQFEERIAELGWDFHEQSTIDFGIDGSVETVGPSCPTRKTDRGRRRPNAAAAGGSILTRW